MFFDAVASVSRTGRPLRHLPDELGERDAVDCRCRWIARPDANRHAKLAEEYQDDPFASAVQRSLEQQARGKLAVEAGDFQQAFGHFLAAELLRPMPVRPEPPKE